MRISLSARKAYFKLDQLDFKEMANNRIEDAKVLLDTGLKPNVAYYLAGYAVECAIITCIMKNITEADLTPTDEDIQEI